MMKYYNSLFKKRRTSSLWRSVISNRGFSLIEVLIVIAISGMLSAIVITYSGTSKNITSLSVEAAKISQFLFQAKSLAIATYSNPDPSNPWCGYGVSFDYSGNGTYSIFAYKRPSDLSSCPNASTTRARGVLPSEMAKYSDATWQVKVVKGIALKKMNPGSVSFVLFYPPAPTTLINLVDTASNQFVDNEPSNIHLLPIGGGTNSQTISINSAGQINL